MKSLKERHYSPRKTLTISIVFIFLILLLGHSLYRVYMKRKEATETLLRMKEDLFLLEQKSQSLKYEINNLSTSEGVDFELRKKLNVKSKDEQVVVIVEKEGGETKESQDVSIWGKIKNLFR